MMWSRDLVTWYSIQTHLSKFYKVMILAQNATTLRPMTYTWYTIYAYDWDLPPMSPCQHYGRGKTLNTKGLDNWSFFINDSKSWKVSSSLLELKGFTLALSIEVLEDFILALLLDGHMQVVKSWKISSLLLELEGFIFALSWTYWKVLPLHYYWKPPVKRKRTIGPDSYTIEA